MQADDIPTSITDLTYTAPGPKLSQNDAAELLAHYWPAIEAHVLRRSAVVAGEFAEAGMGADAVEDALLRMAAKAENPQV